MSRSTKKPELHLVASAEAGAEAGPDSPIGGTSAVYDLMREPETTADRVKRLQQEARALALEEVEMLERLLTQAAVAARAIADGGDAYPVGARELASRLASDLPAKVETLKMVTVRAG